VTDRPEPRGALGRRPRHLAEAPPEPTSKPASPMPARQAPLPPGAGQPRVAKEMLNVRVPPELKDALARAKLDWGVNVEVIVAEAIREYLTARGRDIGTAS
jgi:hypothetical protein